MWAFGKLRLYVQPPLAERLINTFHQGMVEGAAKHPQLITNVLWACASLGYAPSAATLQDLKVFIPMLLHPKKWLSMDQAYADQHHWSCSNMVLVAVMPANADLMPGPYCFPMLMFRWSPNWQDALHLHLASSHIHDIAVCSTVFLPANGHLTLSISPQACGPWPCLAAWICGS